MVSPPPPLKAPNSERMTEMHQGKSVLCTATLIREASLCFELAHNAKFTQAVLCSRDVLNAM